LLEKRTPASTAWSGVSTGGVTLGPNQVRPCGSLMEQMVNCEITGPDARVIHDKI